MRDIQWEALREYYRALLAEQYAQLKEIFQTGALPQGFYGKLVEDGIRLGIPKRRKSGGIPDPHRPVPHPEISHAGVQLCGPGRQLGGGRHLWMEPLFPGLGNRVGQLPLGAFPRGRAGGRGLSYLGKFMFHVKLTSQAVEQIQEIITYISQDLLEHEVAKRWADVLQRTIESLDEMPAPVSTD